MAAAQDDIYALYIVALIYLNGNGVEKDADKGMAYLERSAVLGNADAQLVLAGRYYSGDFIAKDIEKAREWLEKAAALGNEKAKNALQTF